jgi:putative ABC transport system ATP-binding protein
MTRTWHALPSQPGDREEVLRLDRVRKTFPGDPPVEPVRGVDLVVRRGEMLAVVGPSGSGKTTLLHLAAALEQPTSGDVLLEGRSVGRLSDREMSGLRAHRLGVVFQQFFLLETASALDNVAAGLQYRGMSRSDRRRVAARALDRVGLAHRMGHRPAQLSGGERQRVAIARSVVGEPAVVLADEPTGNLDRESGLAVVELLRHLNAQGTTLVVVTHDPDVAAAMPRRVQVSDGRIVSDRTGPGRPA